MRATLRSPAVWCLFALAIAVGLVAATLSTRRHRPPPPPAPTRVTVECTTSKPAPRVDEAPCPTDPRVSPSQFTFDFEDELLPASADGPLITEMPRPATPCPRERTSGPVAVRKFARPEYVRRVVRWNAGAYGACVASATRDNPALDGGRVALRFVFDGDGRVRNASVLSSTAHDAHLEECLVTATRALWILPQPGAQIVVSFPFVLPPREDVDLTPRPPLAELSDRAHDIGVCRRKAELVQREHRAPWIDERVMVAADRLLDEADRWRDGDRACLVDAWSHLFDLAALPHRLGQDLDRPDLLEEAIARYRRLAVHSSLAATARADDLHFYLGEALYSLGRYAEARVAYAAVRPGSAHAGDAASAAAICDHLRSGNPG